jgi:hypothetical protein
MSTLRGFKRVENGLNAINICVHVSFAQPSLNPHCTCLFLVVGYLALTGVTFQVEGVMEKLLVREHKLMGFSVAHDSSSGRTYCTSAAASRERDTHTSSLHLSNGIRPNPFSLLPSQGTWQAP